MVNVVITVLIRRWLCLRSSNRPMARRSFFRVSLSTPSPRTSFRSPSSISRKSCRSSPDTTSLSTNAALILPWAFAVSPDSPSTHPMTSASVHVSTGFTAPPSTSAGSVELYASVSPIR